MSQAFGIHFTLRAIVNYPRSRHCPALKSQADMADMQVLQTPNSGFGNNAEPYMDVPGRHQSPVTID